MFELQPVCLISLCRSLYGDGQDFALFKTNNLIHMPTLLGYKGYADIRGGVP